MSEQPATYLEHRLHAAGIRPTDGRWDLAVEVVAAYRLAGDRAALDDLVAEVSAMPEPIRPVR